MIHGDLAVFANIMEAGFWGVMGVMGAIIAGMACLDSGPARRLKFVWAIAFFVFGGSDLVEAHTGAWWRPWWLLVWKGACLLVFAGVVWRLRQVSLPSLCHPR